MFVTDGATTMRAVGRSLQEHGRDLIHVTCKATQVLKKVFLNLRNDFVHLRSVRLHHSRYPEPTQPILTRWGTWLEAAFDYAKYFEQIKAVILEFNPNEAAAIKEIQTKFQDISVETDSKTIFKYYRYKQLHDAIEKILDSVLHLVGSLQIVNEINEVLHAIDDLKNE
ncbi:hypothetical protein NQ318_012801 [Aromia moschata]|uniref:Uncharacterized protein n=1 Tax=Aromia moschata TaxID=1265417 RepID=A0AAV8YJ87_9CUCU|nr:hypothetical protein NQ318_012801 [Aromia moschata]